MIKIEPIPWEEEILKNYIYKKDGTVKRGKDILHNNLDFIFKRLKQYNNIKKYKCIEKYDYSNSNDLKDKLYKIYDSNSSQIKLLKDKIRSIITEQCPYCSLQVNPYEIDHYLPREAFPEFSIFTLNLVPSCAECNSKFKKTIYNTSENFRAFIHPYVDDLLIDRCFLDCELSVENDILKICYFVNLESFSNEEKEIIKSHFEILDLNNRFKRMIIKEFEKFYKRFTIIENNNKRIFKDDITKELVIEKIEEEINIHYECNCNYYVKVFWNKFKECIDCLKLIYEKKINL